MTKEEDFKLLKIQTCVLRVNIHCDGCKQKVKKLLQRIEGVYQVNIDSEQQKVTVSGSVDSATLIKKLVRAGKHAELWSQQGNQSQKQKNNNCIKDDKNNKGQLHKPNLIKGLEAFKNQQQHKFAPFGCDEDDDFDDEEEEEEEDDIRFFREKVNQLGLLRQQAMEANEAKRNSQAAAMASAQNNGKINNNGSIPNGNSGKKAQPNQNMGMKASPGGIDPKTMAALKLSNNPQFGGGNMNAAGEGRRPSDLNNMLNLGGFHGSGPSLSTSAGMGGNPINGLGGYQLQSNNNGYPASSTGLPNGYATGQYPSSMLMNMNGYNNHTSPSSTSPMMTNMNTMNMHQARQHAMMQQQPQVMYQRSPFIPPSTGYYYNYSPYPAQAAPAHPIPYSYAEPSYGSGSDTSAAHMFSDENTNGCSIM
ncbi:heavy metal-associated isoprenylated plant protein 37-like [Humulus lupulus]|uniref:heavy metal-associated isoprenylated plant protein 37-like n=1 Tax=Humulus lupulus TaxID=3486 RepID=UPI002B407B5E|nr:heavy metal-associated isoprenylated plant protein 37-like [Humulus lupulus]